MNAAALLLADVFIVPLALQLHLETARRVVALFAALYLGAGAWRLGKLCWLRKQWTAGGQAVAAAALLGWFITRAGLFTHMHFQALGAESGLLRWVLPYVLVATLWLRRSGSGWVGLCACAAGVLCGAWVRLWGYAGCAALAGCGWVVRGRGASWLMVLALAAGVGAQIHEVAQICGAAGIWTEWIELPGVAEQDAQGELAEWMRTSTPVDALFVVPPQERGLRQHGERSLFVTAKDGGPAIYSKSYAHEWHARMGMVQRYSELGSRHFEWLARAYGVDFVVTRAGHMLEFPVAYRNERYWVYALKPGRAP